MRDSFIFYRSFFESMEGLTDRQRLEIFNAICKYSLNFEETELTGISKSIFTLIKPNLDANNKRYINGTKGGEHGVKGGRPRNPKETPNITPDEPQENPKLTPNKDKDKDVDKDKDKDDNSNADFEKCVAETAEYFNQLDRVKVDFLEKKLNILDYYIYRKPNTNNYQSLARMIYDGYFATEDWHMIIRTFGISETTLWSYMAKFFAMQINAETYKEWSRIQDMKRHFVNWLNKNK